MENHVKWIDYFCALRIDLEPYSLMFNTHKDSFRDLINTPILLTKYYVYIQSVITRNMFSLYYELQLRIKVN